MKQYITCLLSKFGRFKQHPTLRKYRYLFANPKTDTPWQIANCVEPFLLYMDYKIRPKWYPSWVLRVLSYVNSPYAMRYIHMILGNRKIEHIDTMWSLTDLRILHNGPPELQWLSKLIEDDYYTTNERHRLLEKIRDIDPTYAEVIKDWSLCMLMEYVKSARGKTATSRKK